MILSVILGTDANFDLQNYHLYDPWALFHARLGADYYPANKQSYFDPLADIPYYLLTFVLLPNAPRLVAALAGLPYGLLVFLVFKLSSRFVADRPSASLAALIGLTGATTISEIGTTFNDILATDILLISVWLLCRNGLGVALLAGFLCGFGVGLKLTLGVFAPSLALFLLLSPGGQRRGRLVLLGLGIALGFALAYGWWGLVLWHSFGNPLYPMFNSLFPSQWAAPVHTIDPRFFPKTALKWLAYPFFWVQGNPYVVSEFKLRDPRFALAYTALALALGGVFCKARPSRQTIALWLFFATAYVVWLLTFSILRYALPLEVLSGIIVATVLEGLLPRPRLRWTVAVLAVFCLAFTRPISWGRIGYGESLISAPLPVLPAHTVLLMQGVPLGYVVPFFTPPPAHAIRLEELDARSPEWPRVQALLNQHPPVWLLTNMPGVQDGALPVLNQLNLRFVEGGKRCVHVATSVQETIELCPLAPVSP